MVRAYCCAALSVCVMIVLLGCSPGAKTAKMVPVKGTVNLDGKPMPDGDITFVTPAMGSTTLEVKNGTFTGQVGEGECKVEIRAYKEGSAPVDMGGEKFGGGKENYLPAKFNTETTFTASVKTGGANDFKFDVTSE